MSITAKELAKRLNISAAAVSMALNNKPGISTQTRTYILDSAEKYGYDFSKLSTKSLPTGYIYFVIYKKHGAVVGDTPFFSQLSDGVSEACKRLGFKMRISYIYEEEESIAKQIEDIQYSDCIGLILLGTEMTPDDFKPFSKLSIPIVVLDTFFETISCDCVLINNVQGAYLAAMHLMRATHKQPGYLHSSYSIGNFLERSSGFYKAVRTNGYASANSIVHLLTPSIEGAYADMIEIISSNQDLAPCYFADNDLIALGAMRAFKEKGYRIPEDISIVGFDNQPMCLITEPNLTTINVPKQYMGETAVERLATLLQSKNLPHTKTEISTNLIKRASVLTKVNEA